MSLLADLRYAARALRRAPAFTTAAVLTLALGIGANAAIFSVVDGVLLRPTPFEDVDRLMMVWETDRASGTTREPASIPDWRDFQAGSKQFASVAAFSATELNLTGAGSEPSRVAALAVSDGFLATMGLQPIAGRVLSAEESAPGGPRAVVISTTLARTLFNEPANAVGKSLRLNDIDWSIVGVLADRADFGTVQTLARAAYGRSFAERGDRTRVDVWLGLRASPDASRDNHPIFTVGRLAPGASVRTAQEELTRVAAELERTYPSNENRGVFVEPLAESVFGPVRPALLVLLGAVALVLLVACGNVANLLLVRAAARTRDTSVRIALGAGPVRLARQFFAESTLLVGVGATLGVCLAYAGTRALLAMAPASIPRVDEVSLDLRMLLLTFGVCVLVTLVFGAIPMLQTRVRDLHGALQGGGRGSSGNTVQRRLRSALVVSELAMAVMLMTGAGLLVRSLWQLQAVDPGFRTSDVLKAEFQLPASRYPQDRRNFPNYPEMARFYGELQSRLGALPGVNGVAIAAANPLDAGFTSSIAVVGREAESEDWPEPAIRAVTPSYFATMGVPVRDGRAFTDADAPTGAPAIIINESARDRFFKGRVAIGEKVSLWGAQRTVVGIVGNEHFRGAHEAVPPAVYLPMTQAPIGNAVLVRVNGDPLAFAASLRRVVAELDPQLPLFGVEPLERTLSRSFAQRRFTMTLLLAFAAVAVLLSAIGVHGVLSYAVSQRTRELGIRMALGASAASVRGLVVRQGLLLGAIGLAIGVTGAFALTGVLSSLLFGVGTRDPVTFGGVVIALGTIAALASWLPARKASRLDPLAALRVE